MSVELGSAQSRRLLDADPGAMYVSSGHLLFLRQGTLFAQNFDPVRLELTGNPFPVAEQVASSPQVQAVSVSGAGSIAYRTSSAGVQRQFVWFDRSGKEIGQSGRNRQYNCRARRFHSMASVWRCTEP